MQYCLSDWFTKSCYDMIVLSRVMTEFSNDTNLENQHEPTLRTLRIDRWADLQGKVIPRMSSLGTISERRSSHGSHTQQNYTYNKHNSLSAGLHQTGLHILSARPPRPPKPGWCTVRGQTAVIGAFQTNALWDVNFEWRFSFPLRTLRPSAEAGWVQGELMRYFEEPRKLWNSMESCFVCVRAVMFNQNHEKSICSIHFSEHSSSYGQPYVYIWYVYIYYIIHIIYICLIVILIINPSTPWQWFELFHNVSLPLSLSLEGCE